MPIKSKKRRIKQRPSFITRYLPFKRFYFKLFIMRKLTSYIPNSTFIFFQKKMKLISKTPVSDFLIPLRDKKDLYLVKTFPSTLIFLQNMQKVEMETLFKTKLLRYVYFMTKNKTSLLLHNYSFLYLTSTFYDKRLLYEFKKNLYSFIYKNEIERTILKKYQKVNFILNLSTSNNFSNSVLDGHHLSKELTGALNHNGQSHVD
jgi:hypothetical protein